MGLCGLLGGKQALTGQGSVWALWAAGGSGMSLQRFFGCITGAFAKFAIFENRIFLTRRSQVKFVLTDFMFVHGFDIYH